MREREREREKERKKSDRRLFLGVPDLKVTQSGVRVKKRGKVQSLLPVKVQVSTSVIGHGERGLFLSFSLTLWLLFFFFLSVEQGSGRLPWGL